MQLCLGLIQAGALSSGDWWSWPVSLTSGSGWGGYTIIYDPEYGQKKTHLKYPLSSSRNEHSLPFSCSQENHLQKAITQLCESCSSSVANKTLSPSRTVLKKNFPPSKSTKEKLSRISKERKHSWKSQEIVKQVSKSCRKLINIATVQQNQGNIQK